MEVSPYIHPPFKIATSWSNGLRVKNVVKLHMSDVSRSTRVVTNFIWPYLHQFFDDSHGLKASLKPLRRPFNQYQSRLEAINNGRDIRQINW